ncbi:MAG: DUF928 domain-containing protein [Nitrospirae bacterium YQR-1]
MKKVFFAIMLCLLVIPPSVLFAGDDSRGKNPLITYKPPMLGAPSVRVAAGTRSVEGDSAVLLALVPDHVGFTTKTQPSLCWYVSKPVKSKIEISLSAAKAIKPLLEKEMAEPSAGGIFCVNLKEYGISLVKETEYKWFISAIGDPEHRAKDIVGGGTIIVKDSSGELFKKLTTAKGTQTASLYAQEGFWYDALWSISELIKKTPADAGLREVRASLLEQAGLKEAADFDRK